jgi:pimeloyl-ACP methyl ester carboxylesterase
MIRLFTLLSIVVLSLATVAARAQDPVTLVPYTSESYGLTAVVPEGWTDLGGGIFARQASSTDATLLVQQSAPLTAEELLATILLQLGMTESLAPSGTHRGSALAWTLYEVETQGVAVDFALATEDEITYVVMLQSSPGERDELRDEIYIPALDALAPYVASDEPVPYEVEEVTFENGPVTLAGTLTLPSTAGPHPALVLVSGSGAQDRDETLPGVPIKPFKLLADALTRAGVAVLRYDDRGFGDSTGDFDTANLADFAADAAAAITYLQSRGDIAGDRIGLLGHSEGGMVAAMLAAGDPHLDFVVALAPPGVSGRDVLRVQNRRLLEAEGASEEEIDAQLAFVEELFALGDDAAAVEELAYERALAQIATLPPAQRAAIQDVEEYARTVARQTAAQFAGAGLQSVLDYDPAGDWEKTSLPVLAIFGEKDVQVDAEQNASALETALRRAGNENFAIVILPDANHLFQAAETGGVSEYATLPATFTPDLLPAIIGWLEREGIISGLATPVA